MRKKKFWNRLLYAGCAVALMAIIAVLRQPPSERPPFATSELTVTRADGVAFPFHVEVAISDQEQAYGLMFVKSLEPTAGMIFPESAPREVAFWMKNTLIPLDMLFITTDGRIGHIVSQAQPLDLTPISSEMPVSAVIEIAGGTAEQDGFRVGDRVASPVLKVQ